MFVSSSYGWTMGGEADDGPLFGPVGAADAPLLGVEVVGPGPEVLGKAEGEPLVADRDEALRSRRRQRDGLAAQVGYGLVVAHVHAG